MTTLKAGYKYDFHFKAWNFSIEELDMMVKLTNAKYHIAGEKFIFQGVKYHNACELESICRSNGSIFFIDNEEKAAEVEFCFAKKVGFFNAKVIEKINLFLGQMEKQNVIDSYLATQDKIKIYKEGFEWSITPSSTKTKTTESSFFTNAVLLILKTEYEDRLSLKMEIDEDVFKAIKYSNRLMNVRNHITNGQKLVIQKERKAS